MHLITEAFLPLPALAATTADGHWIHDLDREIVRFTDTIAIRWYGLSYVAGFAVAAWLLWLYHRKGRSPFNFDQQTTALTAVILGVLVGGRLGSMLLYDLGRFIENPLAIVRVWEGGMASHGGFVGVILAIIWFARHTGTPYLRTGDIFATLAPPGFFFGRVANFINGELWGKPSEVSWAVVFPESRFEPTGLVPRHPSQLYEAALEGLLLGIYVQLRFWFTDPEKRCHGQISGEFLIGYALLRIVGETFREPDASLILGLSRGVFYSLFLIAGGVVIIVCARRGRSEGESESESESGAR